MSTVRFDERPGYKIFKEDVCDKIFGKDVVKIKKDAPYNLITGKWTLPDDCLDFKKNFVKRLERLKMRFEKTASYPDLLKLVAQIADVSKCYKAWAKLAALDVMLNNYQMRGIELNKKVERRQTCGGFMYWNKPVKDGYMPDFDLYFDVGIMGDTAGHAIDVIIDVSIWAAGITTKCKITADYPWDDHEGVYYTASDDLYDELTNYLKEENGKEQQINGTTEFQSEVVPQLKYTIRWGEDAECEEEEDVYDAYRLAEKTKDLMFKRFGINFMGKDMFVQVMVTDPYFKNLTKDFNRMNEEYYELLAYYTFCEHQKDGVLLKDVDCRYRYDETVEEVSKMLAGIVIIEDDIELDMYRCHVYMNPNATHRSGYAEDFYLNNLDCSRYDFGILGSFLDYMYGT